ncbi:unnamed protein product [Caenorhabditis auriculariae]|uniref:Uncharacterized protein n=1 Tax=Caenorhabditis auriculariae TaxID=2777116 RepID=A0A8S1GUA8_9PELO|nr:unnamed protein product [Caenorhabditis auriculariae]
MRRRSLENNSPRQRIEAHKTVDRMSSSRRSSLSPTPMPSLLLRASPSHFVDTIDIDDDETEFEQRRLTRKKRKRDEFEFSHGTVHKRPNNPFRTPPGTDVLKSRGNFLPESVQSMKSPRNSLASPNERKITGMLTARLSPSPVSRDNHVRIDDFEDF